MSDTDSEIDKQSAVCTFLVDIIRVILPYASFNVYQAPVGRLETLEEASTHRCR